MNLIIIYTDDTTANLKHVEAFRLMGDRHVMVKCFGNDEVIHDRVSRVLGCDAHTIDHVVLFNYDAFTGGVR